MHRIFLGLAVSDASLLAACYVVGLLTSGEVRVPGKPAPWHGTHFLLGLFTTMWTLLVHSIVYTYFLGTGKWVKEVVRVYQLPEWVDAQAKKNKKKAFRFEFWGMTAVGAAAWFGAGADAQSWNPVWHLGLASLALVFNVGAFFVEYALIVAQARLLIEVKNQADVLRRERYGDDVDLGRDGNSADRPPEPLPAAN